MVISTALTTVRITAGVMRALKLKLRHAGLLLLAALAILPAMGCTSFQTAVTSKWFDMNVFDLHSQQGVNHVLSTWDSRVRITQDTVNGGIPLPGIAGRLYLLNGDSGNAVDATGTIWVQMHDVSAAAAGAGAPKVAEWRFDAASLKVLKRKDGIAEGYTLFLPWETYRADVRKVQLQVCYVPEGGAPYFGEPTTMALQAEDQPPPSRVNQVIPVSNLVPKR